MLYSSDNSHIVSLAKTNPPSPPDKRPWYRTRAIVIIHHIFYLPFLFVILFCAVIIKAIEVLCDAASMLIFAITEHVYKSSCFVDGIPYVKNAWRRDWPWDDTTRKEANSSTVKDKSVINNIQTQRPGNS